MRRRGPCRASTRRLDYLAGLIPEFHGVIFVVTDANQARPAEIAARYLGYTAISGDLSRFIANIAPNPAINLYFGARPEVPEHPAGPRYAPEGG